MEYSEFKEHVKKISNGEKHLSYSSMSQLLKSPYHYFKSVTEKTVTPAMEEGKRFHMALLEPIKFDETYFILDDTEKCKEIGGAKPRSTKAYKEWKAEILESESRELIGIDEHNLYKKMQKAIKRNVLANQLLTSKGENEKKFEFESDYKILGYIDRAAPSYTVDIKKVADASFDKVRWDIKRMNYDLQGAVYSQANGTLTHYLIYIDKGCNVTVVKLSEDTLDGGFQKMNKATEMFSDCYENDKWLMSYDYHRDLVEY